MMTRITTCALCLTLAVAPASAGDLQDSIARAATLAAARQAAQESERRNELLIPGVAAMGIGTVVLLYGLVTTSGMECRTTINSNLTGGSANCGTTKNKGAILAGAAITGAGGYLLWKGNKDAKARPELVTTGSGAMIRQRVRW
jgi:F0F1-type ATP synthase membrane subunit c/vacuolar-type H+-ATPase subunit K